MTPLKNWATVNLIFGVIGLVFALIFANIALGEWRAADSIVKEARLLHQLAPGMSLGEALARSIAAGQGVYIPTPADRAAEKRKSAAIFAVIALIVFISSLMSFAGAANITKADTIIGETFLKCPFCCGNSIVFDAKFGGFSGKVFCRDCHANWEFSLNLLTQSLTRLSVMDYGIALRPEEKALVPTTDDPEHWHKWARERFKQRQQLNQTPPTLQGQAIFCRFCGHRNLPDAKFCSACGKELRA
jgi:5'(3')-deoxyribonucleotidase